MQGGQGRRRAAMPVPGGASAPLPSRAGGTRPHGIRSARRLIRVATLRRVIAALRQGMDARDHLDRSVNKKTVFF